MPAPFPYHIHPDPGPALAVTISSRAVCCFLLAAACKEPASARPEPPTIARFAIAGVQTPVRVEAGAVLPLTLRASLDSGWKIYSLTQKAGGPTPLAIAVGPQPLFQLAGAVSGPAAMVQKDATFGIDTETYDGAPSFVIPIRVADSAKAGSQTLKVTIRSQACSDKVCLDPETTTLKLPVIITDPGR